MSEPLKIDVWSDIACPWCFIGKRRLERGVEQYRADGGEREVEIAYRSYELSPDTPLDFEGSEIDFLAQHKGMPPEQVEQMLAQMTELAAGEGLSYDFGALRHTKTVKAHQLLHLAKHKGVQLALAERLFSAYFTEGEHLGRDEVLAGLAAEVGLDRDEALAVLTEGRYVDAVEADIAQAQAYGISGVPFAVVQGRYGVSGAQEAATFAQVLSQVDQELAGTPEVAAQEASR